MIIALRQRHRFSFLGTFSRRGSWLLHLTRNTGLRQVSPGRIGHDPSNLLPSAVFEFREHVGSTRRPWCVASDSPLSELLGAPEITDRVAFLLRRLRDDSFADSVKRQFWNPFQ